MLFVLTPSVIAADFALSIWLLLMDADPVVKGVLILLVLFSIISWAIIVERNRLLARAFKQTQDFIDRFWSMSSLEDAYSELEKYPDSPVAHTFAAGYKEWCRFNEAGLPSGTTGCTENVGRALRRAASTGLTTLEARIPFLASCGSAAPFIGLFGTVWGILRAFQEIGTSGTTSIAEVGPYIAEALIATAVGLFAAIPAVLFFNYFATRLKVLSSELNHFIYDFLNLVERHERNRRVG